MKNKNLFIIVLVAILIINTGQVAFGVSPVVVELNGELLDFDVNPTIVNDRTFVPMRKIFEELGSDVEWNQEEKSITSTKDDVTIKMNLGSNKVKVNDELIELEANVFLKNDRTMVPLRVISEALGADVEWIGSERKVVIELDYNRYEDIKARNKNKVLSLGMKENELIEEMGQPDRIENYKSGYKLYIYNKGNNYKNYIALGINNDKVVSMDSNSKNWTFVDSLTPMDSIPENLADLIYGYWYRGVTLAPTYDKNDTYITSVGISIKEEVPELINIVFNQDGQGMIGVEGEDLKVLEKLVFDFTNTLRANYGLQILEHNEDLARVALRHSEDMYERDYFAHTSPDGRTFSQRIANINGLGIAGENIYNGPPIPQLIVSSWYNSDGHRENMLTPEFNALGIGLEVLYATQVFGRMR